MLPSYKNKKGKIITLGITDHAMWRFSSRWARLFPNGKKTNMLEEFCKRFHQADKVINLTAKDKVRLKRYGNDTIFFRSGLFTFVVWNAMIVTVEICLDRHLNKRKAAPIYVPLKSEEISHSGLKVKAWAYNENDELKSLYIGRYENNIEKMKDPEFALEIKGILKQRKPLWKLASIYAIDKTGHKDKNILIWAGGPLQTRPAP
jgi:hypothetical protein